ncbi:DUF2332 domain-containing protein [Cryobacterium sp. TMT1-21]|uniref:DUF2332 domain-containing protein n=1 Tax=unclassified Cryobacterium TaxID=2649013 RepID=UPI00106C5EAC|nr:MULTISPECIES: DUF2332 domain-containing protein [unclassified Cryobacterium]TFC86017.1 DUF2332 domain-containing protein [Cryobacterium sp. TmT2-59]TFD16735.1 DUF2332 domain-containing protein [Cryobacterium sp. TMT1-21]TFD38546.1 DUF2332 domain-containing protein [Cryobacterium sp. TMT2-10]
MRASTDPRAATADRYREFADMEARGLSACYEAWAHGVADDPATVALIDRLPAPKRQPNLVFSAARFHGAPVSEYGEFGSWLAGHWAVVSATCLSHSTQTNEPGRCAVLLPALAALPGPLALIEVGASAGLCLYPDRYSYRYLAGDEVERMLHPAAGPSPVVLDCSLTGPVPGPAELPEVVWRAGVDLNPLDLFDQADVAWLDALIWPEHDDRRARLRAAVQLARAEPAPIVRGDLNDQVEALVARAPAGATVVVFHTAVLAYLDEAAARRFTATMHRLPVRWLSNEGRSVVPAVTERLRARPAASTDFVLALDAEPIAFTEPHGRALHWLDERGSSPRR